MLLQIKYSLLDTLYDTFAVHEPVKILGEHLLTVADPIYIEIHA